MRLRLRRLLWVLLGLTLAAAACSSADTPATPEPTATTVQSTTSAPETSTTTEPAPAGTAEPPPDDTAAATPINHLQSLGSHNSYHLPPTGPVAAAMELFAGALGESVDYSHATITEQLEDYGLRHFELDVFADPEGGLYASRDLLSIIDVPVESGEPALEQAGFKVLHIQGIDFESNCLTLVVCLDEVAIWSTANPDHVPLMILLETKTESLETGAAQLGVDIGGLGVDLQDPLQMTPELFADLEAEVLSVFSRERMITPDEIRGEHTTLDQAVRSDGWLSLDAARGRVLFAVTGTEQSLDVYRTDAPALEGRLFFTSAEIGEPDGAFTVLNDPIAEQVQIAEALAAGYLVRTRADADTVEARSGDTSRRDAALASGAQYVSTDYYAARDEFETGYEVRLPEGAATRCNPVTAGAGCSDPVG